MRKNFILLLVVGLLFGACSKDDSGSTYTDPGSNGTAQTQNTMFTGTWYAYDTYANDVSMKVSDFDEIEKAIDNHELLGSVYVSRYNTIDYYATRDMFVFEDGSFTSRGTTPGDKLGRLDNIIRTPYYNVLRIIDKNTLSDCNFHLFVDENMKNTEYKKVATIYNGHIFKSVSLYVKETVYTYTRQDNKMITTNGRVYTVTDRGIIRDGDSQTMVPFDPQKVFGVK